MKALLKKIDARLLPPSQELRYSPYAWLVYLFFFFISFYSRPHPIEQHIAATLALATFLYYYFNTYWVKEGPKVLFNITVIVMLGSVLTLLTPGSSVFFVYAGAFCCMLGSPKNAVIGLATIVTWVVILGSALGLGQYFYIPAVVITIFIGGINIYYHEMNKKNRLLKLSQQEIQQLAQTAERERIARDLHDLIGHTFSVLTLKADLAGKLIDRDIDKAKQEIKDLENISRDALSQVREVVTGFRSVDLNAELVSTKYLLESNNIHFDYQQTELDISEQLNKELAIILKELTTNIIKHADAKKVSANIAQNSQGLSLTISDNGKGFKPGNDNGFGLKGIQERLQKWQGSFTIKSDQGCKVSIFIAHKHLKEA